MINLNRLQLSAVVAFLIACAPHFCVSAADQTVDVETLAGETVAGHLVALSTDSVTISTDSETVELPADEVLSISFAAAQVRAASAAPVHVLLVDGAAIVADQITTDRSGAHLQLGGTDESRLTLPSDAVANVRFNAGLAGRVAEFHQIAGQARGTDLLVVDTGEALDYLEGTVAAIEDERILFSMDGETLRVKRSKVAGVIYFRGENEMAAPPIHVVTHAGSRFPATSLQLNEDQLQLATAGGWNVELPIDRVLRVDLSGDKVVYLSDLQAQREVWQPFFEQPQLPAALIAYRRPRRDAGFGTDALHLDGRTYRRGLALCSHTEIEFRLPAGYSRLLTRAGIDDRMRPAGHVELTIVGDKQQLLHTTLSGSDEPQDIDVDISGARRLVLIVGFGADLDYSDYVNLCEARIVR